MAMIEVFLSSLILGSVAGSAIALSYSMSLSQKTLDFNIQNAFYDFSNILYRNSSYGSCVLRLGSCATVLLSGFDANYQLGGSLLAIENESARAGNLSGCSVSKAECFPVRNNASFVQVCLTLCG